MDLSGLVIEGKAGLKHERLRSYLLSELKSGRLQVGDALPTELDLSRQLQISRNTIRQAFSELERNGFIRRVRGKGTFVAMNDSSAAPVSMQVFALILPELRTAYYPSIIRTFEKSAADLSYQVMACNSDNDIHKQADLALQLIDNQVAGVAIVPATTPATPIYQIAQLQKHGIPVVICHRHVPGVSAPLLSLPFHEIARRAGQALVGRGHRRVAYLDLFRDDAGVVFEAGLRSALQSVGADLPAELVCYGNGPIPDPIVHEKEVLAQLQGLLNLASPPTAILTGFTSTAELIFLLLKDMGVRIPEDISLMSFGGAWREGAVARRISAVTVNESETARKAVQLLHEMRSGKRPIDDNEVSVIPVSFYEGQTLASPSNKKPTLAT